MNKMAFELRDVSIDDIAMCERDKSLMWRAANEIDALAAERDRLASLAKIAERQRSQWEAEANRLSAITVERERELAEARGLLRDALNAWTGDGPPIELDRLRAALAGTTANGTVTRKEMEAWLRATGTPPESESGRQT